MTATQKANYLDWMRCMKTEGHTSRAILGAFNALPVDFQHRVVRSQWTSNQTGKLIRGRALLPVGFVMPGEVEGPTQLLR